MHVGIGRKLKLLLAAPPFIRNRVMAARYRNEIDRTGEAELRLLPYLVDQNRPAVDVGCNLGVYAFRLSQLASTTYAFEPNPSLAKLVDDQRLNRVQVNCVALSDSNSRQQLYFPKTRSAHVLASLRHSAQNAQDMDELSVQTATLDSFELPDVGFLKIDVEGHEEAVLHGAHYTISQYKPTILCEIEERHNKGGLERILAKLSNENYRCIFFFNRAWNDIDKFDYDLHHDYDRSHATDFNRREEIQYCNNFVFIAKDAPLPGGLIK